MIQRRKKTQIKVINYHMNTPRQYHDDKKNKNKNN